MILEDSMSM